MTSSYIGLLSTYPGLNLLDSTIMVQHLGVVYILMSFIGCVRSLMAESCLVDILSCAFGGVDHMFTGNKFPQNFLALRLLVETVIQNTVQESNDDVDMISCYESHARSS